MGSPPEIPSLANIFKSTVSGGILINIVFNPFDVVKNFWYYNYSIKNTRTQMSSLDVVRHIYRTNGLSSFWLGLNWAMPMTIFGHTLFLYTYDSIKNDVCPPVASLISRVVTLVPSQPLDCIRTYVQSTLYTSQRPSFAQIIRKNGFMSLYKGSWTTMVRDVPFSSIHWPINEYLYHKVASMEVYRSRQMTHFESVAIPFSCGSFSSLLATFVSQPFDVVKTNLQAMSVESNGKGEKGEAARKFNMYSEFKRIYKTYGMRGMFIGATPRLLKVVPGSAIMSATYHYFN